MARPNPQNKYRVGATLAVALALSGCAGAPIATSRTHDQAVTFNHRGGKAFEQGDYRSAQSYYERALALDTSIEDADGIAINALSLARVHQALGETPLAQSYLDRVLQDGPLAAKPAQRAEAAARKAQFELAAGRAREAEPWLERAQALCAACPAQPAIFNLRARAALARAEHDAALSWAGRALALASGDTARAERANAYRLLAEIRIARGEFDAAANDARQALELDRALGLAERIYLDLMQLGQASARQARVEQAREFFGRASAVALASGNLEASNAAQRELEHLTLEKKP